jgi:hypothetical protein
MLHAIPAWLRVWNSPIPDFPADDLPPSYLLPGKPAGNFSYHSLPLKNLPILLPYYSADKLVIHLRSKSHYPRIYMNNGFYYTNKRDSLN